MLERLRDKIPVESLIAEFRQGFSPARKLSLDQEQLIASMPVKIASKMRSLLEQGFPENARAAFQRGENPFPERGPKHIRLAGSMLLGGGFHRVELRDECVHRYGWSDGTASSQVSQTVALLRGLGLTKEQGGFISLPETLTQTA
jgi:hypothetical protein